jgi:ribosome biogenesis protein YTM1
MARFAFIGHLPTDKENQQQLQTVASIKAHDGPIKCLASCAIDDGLLIATGSLDQTLVTHRYNGGKSMVGHAHFREGHTAAIGCVAFDAETHMLVSGDWDGGMCIWNTQATVAGNDAFAPATDEAPARNRKSVTGKSQPTLAVIQPLAVFGSAHSSQISSAAWMADGKHVVTGSWDHSVKVWSVESQDCLLTLNGSRVVSCMDLSTHSEVVATGHPDCTIRLWDVRTVRQKLHR